MCIRDRDGIGKITIDGVEYLLHEGESIVMPAGHPHAVYGQEAYQPANAENQGAVQEACLLYTSRRSQAIKSRYP